MTKADIIKLLSDTSIPDDCEMNVLVENTIAQLDTGKMIRVGEAYMFEFTLIDNALYPGYRSGKEWDYEETCE